MAKLCADAGFLIALYDPRDEHHEHAEAHFQALFATDTLRHVLLAPWPILYESLNTRQARRRGMLERLRTDWDFLERHEQLDLLDDGHYRLAALRDYLETGTIGRSLSLADRVIRAVIADTQIGMDAILTYNAGDFADVCAMNRIQIIDQHVQAPLFQGL